MQVNLHTDHHLEFLSLKDTAQARLSLHLSKFHIVGKHVSQLIFEQVLDINEYQCKITPMQDT